MTIIQPSPSWFINTDHIESVFVNYSVDDSGKAAQISSAIAYMRSGVEIRMEGDDAKNLVAMMISRSRVG